MKRKIKKLICLILSIILIQINILPLYSSAENSYQKYLALGDSIAYGYGLKDKDKESYAAKVKAHYNISDYNFSNLAVSGMKCEEFYQVIQTEKYTKAIENADLITISIGSNELLQMGVKIVAQVTGVSEDDDNFLEKAKEKIVKAPKLEQIKMLAQMYSIFTSEEMKEEMAANIESYKENWVKSVKYIKQKNPNVEIVATQFYNPYYEIQLASYDLGGFVDENIQKMNEILEEVSNNEKEYKIARIYELFNTTNPRITNVNISISDFCVDLHPNTLGHKGIYTKIIDVLSKTTATKNDISKLTINDIEDQEYTGKAIEPKVIIKDGNKLLEEGIDYTVSYKNQIAIGQASIIINGIGNYKGSVIKSFNIKNTGRKDISSLNVSSIEDQMYIGIKNTPDVEIKDGNKMLKKDVDYNLIYSNNINVGNAKILIEGIGNYSGTKDISFKIVPKDIKYAVIKQISDQEYKGKVIKPEIEITDGSAKLIENNDYSVEYTNNVEIGQATVNIIGKGNYTGNIRTEFNIVSELEVDKIDINTIDISEIGDKIYTGKLITPEIQINDQGTKLIKNNDYIISYKNNMNIGTGIAIIEGTGKYTGKLEKKFNIVQKDIKFTTIEDISDQIYTGDKIQPEIIITSDFIKLEEGKDYKVSYSNNIEVGTALITIQGIGNYKGTIVKSFNIKTNKEDEKINNNKDQDNTISKKILPFAGNKVVLFMIVIISVIYVVIKMIIYNKKFKDVK